MSDRRWVTGWSLQWRHHGTTRGTGPPARCANGNIQVNSNTTGGGTLTGNTAGGNCQLQNDNPPITGSGNTAGTGHQNTCNTTA